MLLLDLNKEMQKIFPGMVIELYYEDENFFIFKLYSEEVYFCQCLQPLHIYENSYTMKKLSKQVKQYEYQFRCLDTPYP